MNEGQLFNELNRQNFHFFLMNSFRVIRSGEQLETSNYLEALCFRLQQVAEGSTRRLLINLPPRHLKSIAVSVALTAWMIGQNPHLKILVATYNEELGRVLEDLFKTLIESDLYRQTFPEVQFRTRTGIDQISTTRGGFRRIITPRSTLTGIGCDMVIFDDVMKSSDIGSFRVSDQVHQFFLNAHSRFDRKRDSRIIVSQQRFHEDDLSGRLIETGTYEHLNLEAIASRAERHPLYFEREWHRRAGDALFPEREPLEILDTIRREIGSIAFSAQYLQNPIAAAGCLVRREWFHYYDQPLDPKDALWIVQSWDHAYTAEPDSNFSVCTTWGYYPHLGWCLLDLQHVRLESPALTVWIIELARRWRPRYVLLEQDGGMRVRFHDLRAQFVSSIQRVNNTTFRLMRPEGNKAERLAAVAPMIERGEIKLPHNAVWLDRFVREMTSFPNARNDDIVDSTSQFLRFVAGPLGRDLIRRNPVTGRVRGRSRRHLSRDRRVRA